MQNINKINQDLFYGVLSMSIKFSVLIPVYNVEKYLIDCVNSVLKQTYQNFEIILIDDGSTDSSGVICDDFLYKDNRIKVFHQENQGLLITRRNLLKKSNGDFCIFLDSDDYWDINLLESVNTIICEHKCDMVIFKHKIVSHDKIIITDSVFEDQLILNSQNKNILFENFINSSILNNLWNKAFKSTIIDKENEYFEYKQVKNGEDLLQLLPLICNASKIVYLDKPLYNYRINFESITHTFNLNFFRDFTIVRGKLLEYLNKLKYSTPLNLKNFFTRYVKVILDYIYTLINQRLSYKEKIVIFYEIKKINLYIEAMNYVSYSDLTLKYIIGLFLFNKNYYRFLFIYGKTIAFLRKVRNLLLVNKALKQP